MASVQRLNHAVLYVGNVDTSVEFYRHHLGMEVAVAFKGAAFLRSAGSTNDHDLGLFQVGETTPGPQSGRRGLYHLAWQVDTIDDLASIRASLSADGSLVGESDHGVSKSLYAHDPDGIEFEIMWAVPVESRLRDVAPVAPLDLVSDVKRWAGVSTGQIGNVPAPH